MPMGLTRDILATAYRQAKADLAPVSAEGFAVNIQPLLDFAVVFGKAKFVDQSHREAVISEYREAMSDLPADLIRQAVLAQKRAWIYPGMPTPAELIAHVSAEYWRRRHALGKITLAGQRLPAPEPKREAIDVSGLLAKLRAAFTLPNASSVDGVGET